MSRRLVAVTASLLAAAAAVGVWAQEKRAAGTAEDAIRLAAFRYYFGTVFGDADKYLEVTRMPVYVVRDGAGSARDEKQTRALLAHFAGHVKDLDKDARDQMAKNLLAAVDASSVQFVGANTATIAIPLTLHAKEDEPQRILTLTLYRKDGTWRVISELSDSTAIPPEYTNK